MTHQAATPRTKPLKGELRARTLHGWDVFVRRGQFWECHDFACYSNYFLEIDRVQSDRAMVLLLGKLLMDNGYSTPPPS